MNEELENQKEIEVKIKHEMLDNAIASLKKIKKIDFNDRVIFAKNIGLMLQSAQDNGKPLTPRKLIKDAFSDETTQESYNRRRKELITMPGEKPNKKLIASWHPYNSLIKSLKDKIPPHKKNYNDEKAYRTALLRLIDGSSFEPKNSRREHINSNFVKQISDALDKVLIKVLSEVDLEWMRLYLEDYMLEKPSLGPDGDYSKDGDLKKLVVGDSWIEKENISLPPDSYAWKYPNIAPQVTLGRYIIEEKVRSVNFKITINKDLKNISRIDITDALVELCKKEDGYEWIDEFRDLDEIIATKKLSFECFDDFFVERNEDLNLKILYSEESNKWQFALCRQSNTHYLHNDGENLKESYIFEILSSGSTKIFDLSKEVYLYRWFAELINEGEDSTEFRIFYCNIYEDFDSRLDTWANMYIISPESKSHDFYDILLDKHNFIPDYEDEDEDYPRFNIFVKSLGDEEDEESQRHVFVKAPTHSLSDYILRNLISAKDENKIHNILIADAKKKYALLKEFSKKNSADFDKQLSSVLE